MQIITMVLILLLAVTVSGFIVRLSPVALPLPLIQIATGAIIASFSPFDVSLDPAIFFLLFIPPLLFLDGWRIPKEAFFLDMKPILMLAIGLVIFTVVGMGFLIDWLIPAIPLPVAFALAAILSPTDPVAVSAIASKTPIPPRLMHILEGESLLNDASGLVCFRFAVLAALTGNFSLAKASWTFMLVAGGGALIGIVLTYTINLANRWLIRQTGEEPGVQIMISLLIPFAAYLTAEHLNASGILAAVTAGVTMHYSDLTGHTLAATRMQRRTVWDTVQMILNGIMFMLLGLQLPRILESIEEIAIDTGIASLAHLSAYIVCITFALTTLRLIWVWASLKLTLFGKKGNVADKKSFPRLLLVTAFAGVRGAITLAGILTLPLTMLDGTDFPARDLVIFLAMGVILLSLIVASIALPILAAGFEFSEPVAQINKETVARNAAASAAIRRVEDLYRGIPNDQPESLVQMEAAMHVIELYRRRLAHGLRQNGSSHHIRELDVERQMRIEALRAERDQLYQLRLNRQLDDVLHRQLVHEIDLIETALTKQKQH
ncbi:Na+/H+ antiporter [Undibacterium sp. 14-3-2]|uniref:Na+/H+ antiporter n=1 Tax=Undibacterium sp. 14-3-2 TaxID=2800129 RepID=UPI0019075265|nr:Na+/H+ antiporter [Undibacterium sp. 14-3-2]MBK1891609.1 Na+/H+ antiporter [Undibacterium sp. 14-3-2]